MREIDLLRAESQGLEPDEGVRREVREAAQPQRLGHQPQVLQHPALFYGDKLAQSGFEKPDRGKATRSGVVVQVTALGPSEPSYARRLEAVAFVHHEVAELLAEGREQDVDVEGAAFGNRQEVGGGG